MMNDHLGPLTLAREEAGLNRKARVNMTAMGSTLRETAIAILSAGQAEEGVDIVFYINPYFLSSSSF